MATVSVLDDVIAALVTICQAAVGASVPVYDGLPYELDDTQFVVIGDDAAQEGGGMAGTTAQTRADYNLAAAVTEAGDVTCVVVCQTGDDDLTGQRAASRVLMLAIETALRADRTLGGVVIRANVTAVTIYQSREGGSVVRRVFTVHYDAHQG